MCTHKHTCMVTKTITVTEDAYDVLASHKQSSESFSQEIKRLLVRKSSILDLAGVWRDVSEKEAADMKATIKLIKKNAVVRA